MYNNIGLKTVRGSGTNGYVQTNLAKLPANWNRFRGRRRGEQPDAKRTRIFKPDPKLIEHNTKRAIEVKVFEFRTKLEEQDFGDDDIEDKVDAYRKVLQAQLEAGTFVVEERKKDIKKHEDAMDRMKKNMTMKKALGIGEDHVHGRAFDQDLQESERRERIAKREAEMTIQEKLEEYNRSYLDRLGGAGEGRGNEDSRRERNRIEDRIRNDPRINDRTRFSRSSSRGKKHPRSPEDERNRQRHSPPREPRRSREKRERRPEKIERWRPGDELDKPKRAKKERESRNPSGSAEPERRKKKHRVDVKSKSKKKRRRKKRKPKPPEDSSSDDQEESARDRKKREERKKRAAKNKKNIEESSSPSPDSDDYSV